MNPNDDVSPPAGGVNNTNEPHLGHGLRKLQPLHSAEEIAAQIAADENVPANIDQPGQTPEPAAETGQSPSSEDSAEPVSPPAIANNEIVPAIDISNSYAVPLHTDDAAPSAQTTPPAPPLADEPEPVIAPVVVGSGIQATPPANLPNTASFSPANPAASGLVNPPFTPSPPPSSPKKRGKILKFLPVAIVVIILAAGGSAAYAYVKYYQPEHNLETALNNTLQQKQIHYTGTLSTDPTSPQALPAYKVTFTGQSDLASKSTDVQVNLTIDGVTFPVEARLVDQNLYFKLGDLNEIIGLVNSLAPSEAPLVKSLSSQLFNKWIEVDSTLLKKAGASCELDSNLNLTAADMKIVDQQLQKHQFVTIKSMASSSLSGRAAEEYSLQLNDNKLADFAKNLNQLSAVKALQTCSGQKSNPPLNTKSIADNDTTPITIWVDKSTKRIVKLTTQTTTKDEQKYHEIDQLSVNLSYSPVSLSAPKNALPVIQVIAQIEASLLGSGGSSASSLQGLGLNGATISQNKTPTNATSPLTQTL